MTLVASRAVAHFSSPGTAVSDIHQDAQEISDWNGYLSKNERLDTDLKLDIDLQQQIVQWLNRKTEITTSDPQKIEMLSAEPIKQRKSSLKDTSETKFPKTPKTKSVRWREGEFFASYQKAEDQAKLRAEELLLQILDLGDKTSPRSGRKRNTVQSLSRSKDGLRSGSKRISPIPTAKTPLLHERQARVSTTFSRPTYRTGSYRLIADNQEFYAANGSNDNNGNSLGASVSKTSGSAFTFAKGYLG